jgi:hypothetical protein
MSFVMSYMVSITGYSVKRPGGFYVGVNSQAGEHELAAQAAGKGKFMVVSVEVIPATAQVL